MREFKGDRKSTERVVSLRFGVVGRKSKKFALAKQSIPMDELSATKIT
jgi:hypothetical protein